LFDGSEIVGAFPTRSFAEVEAVGSVVLLVLLLSFLSLFDSVDLDLDLLFDLSLDLDLDRLRVLLLLDE